MEIIDAEFVDVPDTVDEEPRRAKAGATRIPKEVKAKAAKVVKPKIPKAAKSPRPEVRPGRVDDLAAAIGDRLVQQSADPVMSAVWGFLRPTAGKYARGLQKSLGF